MNDPDPVPAAIELRGVSKHYEAVTAPTTSASPSSRAR